MLPGTAQVRAAPTRSTWIHWGARRRDWEHVMVLWFGKPNITEPRQSSCSAPPQEPQRLGWDFAHPAARWPSTRRCHHYRAWDTAGFSKRRFSGFVVSLTSWVIRIQAARLVLWLFLLFFFPIIYHPSYLFCFRESLCTAEGNAMGSLHKCVSLLQIS